MTYVRDYDREYKEHGGTSEQKKRRAARNKARAKAMKAGTVSKGDGREVDHVNAPRKGSLDKVKTRVIPQKLNRSIQPSRGGKR